jgi:hypothetical protein
MCSSCFCLFGSFVDELTLFASVSPFSFGKGSVLFACQMNSCMTIVYLNQTGVLYQNKLNVGKSIV